MFSTTFLGNPRNKTIWKVKNPGTKKNMVVWFELLFKDLIIHFRLALEIGVRHVEVL